MGAIPSQVAPTREPVPDSAHAPIALAAPPKAAESAQPGNWVGMIVLPVVAGSGALLMTISNPGRPMLAALGLLVLAASVIAGLVMVIGSRTGTRRRVRESRERYLDYLETLRRTLQQVARGQRRRAAVTHPDPADCAELARLASRRWERRPADDDYLLLRVGLGPVRLSRPVRFRIDEQDPLADHDPVCLSAARELVDAYSRLDDQPVCLPLGAAAVVSVIGAPERTRGIARALIAQLVCAHSPDDVVLLIARDEQDAADWEWAKWLPHVADPRPGDGPVPSRLLIGDAIRVARLMDRLILAGPEGAGRPRPAPAPAPRPQSHRRRFVVVVDGPQSVERQTAAWPVADRPVADPGSDRSGPAPDIHRIHLLRRRLDEPARVDIRLTAPSQPDGGGHCADLVETLDPAMDAGVHDPGNRHPAAGDRGVTCRFDELGIADGALLARTLAPGRAHPPDRRDAAPTGEDLPGILGVADVAALDPGLSWRPRAAQDLLRVPIGLDPSGERVLLDLKESASGGMGPHGLVVGATGSGKSELLRTLVAALVVRHPPDTLALLLADFKGGATFAGLSALPHVAGMITNLADDPGMVERFRTALQAELVRRQQTLADAGRLTDLHGYTELRRGRTDLEPLPNLLVIVDEFSELLSARPDLADLFVAVGRIGRSVGIHLLLATQRLEMGRIRGLESHLSYRICLRTFSEVESREAIGTPDAFHLPAEPGSAYLTVDSTHYQRFRAARVTGPHRRPRPPSAAPPAILPFTSALGVAERIDRLRVVSSRAARSGADITEVLSGNRSDDAPAHRLTVLEVVIERLQHGAPRLPHGRPVRRIWLDPLPCVLTLHALPSAIRAAPENATGIRATVGLLDVPDRQRQDPLELDFAGGAGNVVIVGAGMSGKSTTLRTLVASLALQYEPGRLALYCVDYSSGGLAPFARLPHVAAVAGRADPDLVRRTFSAVAGMLEERENLMRTRGWESAGALRRARAAGQLDHAVPADVFLIIDGWAAARESDETLDDLLADITTRGPAVGIHTIITVTTPAQLRSRLAAGFGGRLELRLTDPFDSAVDRGRARDLPAVVPGRALVTGGHYAQIALPQLGPSPAQAGSAGRPGGSEALLDVICARWTEPPVRRVRTLPPTAELREVRAMDPASAAGTCSVVLGLAEPDLAPAWLDLRAGEAHLLVYGDPRSGKTSLLRCLGAQLAAGGSGVLIGTVDYRHGLTGEFPAENHRWNAGDSVQAQQVVAEIVAVAVGRLPGPSVTPGQLRRRGWWSGPEICLLVDDYDLVSAVAGNPLLPLLPLLAHGQDVGLHVVLARRCGGASRAQYETTLQTLGDLGTPVLLFSGDKSEGRLGHGVAPRRLPPGRALLATRSDPARLVQTAWLRPRR